MSTNVSTVVLLTLETLGIPSVAIYPVFLFSTLTYILIVLFNLVLLVVITLNKKLHKPMFILLFNLPISDLTGATALFPHMISSILSQNRQMPYSACVTQAFLIHFYGTGNLLILTAMAYDRYVAICHPLRYNAIMTPQKLTIIIFFIWLLNFALVMTLIALLVRFKPCRSNVVDLYCNNPSLVRLVCDNTMVNNIYGLSFMSWVQGGTSLLVMYSYAQILRTCVMTNQADARKKAIQTCGTHLVVFLLLQINTLVMLISHRLKSVSPYARRLLGVSVIVFPPLLDPIIYGLKTAELKHGIETFLKRKGQDSNHGIIKITKKMPVCG